MSKYYRMHVHAFRKGTNIRKPWQALLLELAKFFLITLLLVLFLYILARVFVGATPLLTTLNQIETLEDTSANEALIEQALQQGYLLDIFKIRLVALIISLVLFLGAILALFNTMIMERLRDRKWNRKRFMKLFYIYTILSAIYFLVTFVFLYKLVNMTALAIMMALFTFIYLYMLLIFAVSIDDRSIWKDIQYGILNCIRIHRTIPALFLGFFVVIGIFVISGIIALLVKGYAVIILIILLSSWSVWMKNYQDYVLRE
jgi:hypothetical protein